jgi:simple sugar transport system permease protein
MMLAGAFFSIVGASITGTVVGGLGAGMLAGLCVAAVHANMSHRLQANTFVVGLTLNVLLLGLTNFLLEAIDPGRHQAGSLRFPILSEIPIVGEPLFANRWPLYLLAVVIPSSWFLVNRTNWGLELRACGENPQAADVTGIDVNRRRRQGLYYAGLMTGLGGSYLALGEVGLFNQNMTAGRGFLVNAAIIFGGWRLGGALLGCLLFGGTDALRLALPALGVEIQPQLLIALPYLLAIVAMCFFAIGGRPAALGKPFERGIA